MKTVYTSIKGFNFVEIIIVVAIVGLLFAVLAPIFNIGEVTISRDLEKLSLFLDMRQIMYQVVRDVRHTSYSEINDNGPSDSYLRFRVYSNYNSTSETPVWSSGYIEYDYVAANHTLTRSDGNSNIIRTYYNVTNAPFNISSLSSGSLTVGLSAERPFRGSNLTGNLTTEVKIRN